MAKADLLDYGPALTVADTIAYSFHTQTFFLVAGYFAFRSAGRLDAQLRRQTWLYHAYLLWSLLTWTTTWLASSVVNHPPTLRELLTIPYTPYLQYWFLPVLMQGTLLLGFLRSGPALLAGCALLLAIPMIGPDLPPILSYSGSIVLMLIGAWLRVTGLRPPAQLLAALPCIAVLFLSALFPGPAAALLRVPYGLIVTLCGCYAAYALASWLATVKWAGDFLCLCGRQSLTIYLTHIFAGAATRIVLARLAPGLPVGIMAALIIAASIAGPLLFARIAAATRTSALFGLKPFWPERRAGPPG